MVDKYYLNIEGSKFGFIVEGIHQIQETDIEITNEEYNEFFHLQSQGKQFKLKEIPTGIRLFDYIEEYIPEVDEVTPEPGLEEIALDHEYRISKLELGV